MTEEKVDIDLDAARAARREALSDPYVVRNHGKAFTLPAELPLDVIFVTQGGAAEALTEWGAAAVAEVLLAEQWSAFVGAGPISTADCRALVTDALARYGVSPGKSSGSAEPSSSTGEPSKPTSAATTEQTSDGSAGEQKKQ